MADTDACLDAGTGGGSPAADVMVHPGTLASEDSPAADVMMHPGTVMGGYPLEPGTAAVDWLWTLDSRQHCASTG